MIIIPGFAVRDTDVIVLTVTPHVVILFLSTAWGEKHYPMRITLGFGYLKLFAGSIVLYQEEVSEGVFIEARDRIERSLQLYKDEPAMQVPTSSGTEGYV